jgi:hypothetical protein
LDKSALGNVSVDFGEWPVLGKDFLAIGVDLAERDGSHPGSFKSEAESANPRKKVQDIHKISPDSPGGSADARQIGHARPVLPRITSKGPW